MNDISDKIAQKSDLNIGQDIGKYIKAIRLRQNKTQSEVALEADMSRSTLSLMENGDPGTVTNLIKILRVLDQLHIFKAFEIKQQISPLLLAKEAQNQYKRVKKKKKTLKKESNW
ncbi:helix-turn-helix domain-containing protein [Saprospiraceae bacterium]|nr:helix-turn-helix domain-containing protein [Saprospiraceae bacterium]